MTLGPRWQEPGRPPSLSLPTWGALPQEEGLRVCLGWGISQLPTSARGHYPCWGTPLTPSLWDAPFAFLTMAFPRPCLPQTEPCATPLSPQRPSSCHFSLLPSFSEPLKEESTKLQQFISTLVGGAAQYKPRSQARGSSAGDTRACAHLDYKAGEYSDVLHPGEPGGQT